MITVSLVVLCGLALAALARRRSAALRHWILTAALGCAAVSPFLDRVLPAWSIGLPPLTTSLDVADSAAPQLSAGAPGRADGPAAGAGPFNGTAGPSIATWLTRIWVAGAALSLSILLIGVGRLAWLSARADRLREGPWVALADALARADGLTRPIGILQSRHPALLVTWGLLRPRIMLPAGAESWPEARIRVVLGHELAHIRRGDWIPQLLAEALRSVFWFDPLLWIASRRLRLESERACDDAVLRSGIAAPEYAAHLLDLARAARQHRLRPHPGFPAPAMARPCSLERRVTAMLNTTVNRTPMTRSGRLAALLPLLAFTVIVGAAAAGAQGVSRFSGSIMDPTNAAVPAVTVVLTNVQTGETHEVRSDRQGRFEFAALAAGDYLLEARLPGFASFKGRITVGGQEVRKDLTMELGTVSETITVATVRGGVPTGSRVSEAPAAARALGPCTPSGSGGDIRPPRKVKDVKPAYPQAASDAGISGDVIVDARIGGDGLVTGIEVREAADADLARAAVDAIRLWEFTPTLLGCTPVDVAMKVTVHFQLRP